jgi:predicted Zn finger-like uncharacterized protein
MIIECKNCLRKFNLNENLLKPDGSKVRCTKCGNIFLVFPSLLKRDEKPPAMENKISLKELISDKTDPSVIEKRMHQRIRVSVPASCISTDADGNPLDFNIGRITDVSQEGLAIEVFCSSLSESTLISFITLEDKEIQIAGKVVHSEKNSKGRTKIGLSLTGTSKEIADFVSNVVRYHHYTTKPAAKINYPAATG